VKNIQEEREYIFLSITVKIEFNKVENRILFFFLMIKLRDFSFSLNRSFRIDNYIFRNFKDKRVLTD